MTMTALQLRPIILFFLAITTMTKTSVVTAFSAPFSTKSPQWSTAASSRNTKKSSTTTSTSAPKMHYAHMKRVGVPVSRQRQQQQQQQQKQKQFHPFFQMMMSNDQQQEEAIIKSASLGKKEDGTVYDDEPMLEPIRDNVSTSMKERLMREASVGLDSEKSQTNVILYVSVAVAILVALGGQGILY